MKEKSKAIFSYISTKVKLAQNDNTWGPQFWAIPDKWSLFRGSFVLNNWYWDFIIVVVVGKWSLFGGVR